MTRLRVLVPALVIGFVLQASAAKGADLLDGHWAGAFDRDGSVQLVEVDFVLRGDTLSGTYAIPELSLYEETLGNLIRTDSTIQFRTLYGDFLMICHGDHGELTGLNDKVNPPIKLHLKKETLLDPPFFSKENLSFKGDHVVIAATLYKPAGIGPFPAAVIIPGSGEIGRGTWFYRSLVYGLVHRGIAALIYDKRGVGESTGSLSTADFKDLAKDALAMVDSLRKRSDIIPNHVGLYGMSQGGWIAAVAGHKSKELAFVVLMEGPAEGVWQEQLDAIVYTMSADNYSKPSIDSALEYTRLYFEAVKSKKKFRALAPWVPHLQRAKWAKYVNIPLRENDVDMVWLRVNNYDPENDLSGMRCPVLAIFGEEDTLVPPQTNLEKMKAYLTKAGVKYSVITVHGLGHSVKTAERLEGGTWNWPRNYWVWSRRPEMIDDSVSAWILENSKPADSH